MKYIVYDQYPKSSQPLLSSSYELLAQLGLEVIASHNLRDCGGYFARLAQKDELLCNVAYNLALANAANATLLFLEEDAYANALYAKMILESQNEVLREVESACLQSEQLVYDSKVQMLYLPDLLNSLDIGTKIKKHFSTFEASIVRGGYQAHLPKSTNHRIYEQIKLTIKNPTLSSQYYAHLLGFNPQGVFEHSGRFFFEIADLGVDFILSHSLSQFEILDGKRSQICAACNRDNIPLSVLFLPQVLLLALGCEDRAKLGFDGHRQKVEIL